MKIYLHCFAIEGEFILTMDFKSGVRLFTMFLNRILLNITNLGTIRRLVKSVIYKPPPISLNFRLKINQECISTLKLNKESNYIIKLFNNNPPHNTRNKKHHSLRTVKSEVLQDCQVTFVVSRQLATLIEIFALNTLCTSISKF